MKNIDFTDFFNVFLSGATLSGAFFVKAAYYSSGSLFSIIVKITIPNSANG